MDDFKITVVGGRRLCKYLTNKLSDQDYAVSKACAWAELLQESEIPTKWFKRQKDGTKVSFNIAKTKQEWEDSLAKLKAYIAEVNQTYDLDLELTLRRKKANG